MGGGRYPAPAKLNLMLRVVGRRADGYHRLQTVFRLLDFGDTISVSVRSDGRICRSRELPGVAEDDDLTIRAARLLQSATGTGLGAELGVEKRVPQGGGLGGGSSDAATVLLALNHLWRTGLSRTALQALGAQLGADVPVFVFGESAWAEGIGDILQPIELPPAWYVVLVPPVSVPTARIFGHPELKRDSEPIKMHGFSAEAAANDRTVRTDQVVRNDLQELVVRLYPEVASHLDWLRQHGAALMTGSGACVFAAFDSEPAAQAVYAQRPAGMQGFVARGLDRHPLWSFAAGDDEPG